MELQSSALVRHFYPLSLSLDACTSSLVRGRFGSEIRLQENFYFSSHFLLVRSSTLNQSFKCLPPRETYSDMTPVQREMHVIETTFVA